MEALSELFFVEWNQIKKASADSADPIGKNKFFLKRSFYQSGSRQPEGKARTERS